MDAVLEVPVGRLLQESALWGRLARNATPFIVRRWATGSGKGAAQLPPWRGAAHPPW